MAIGGSAFGKVNRTLNVDSVGCGGAEFNLSSCPFNTIYNYTVGRIMAQTGTVAGVLCQLLPPTSPPTVCPVTPTASQTTCATGSVQLLGGQSDRGVLMYCYNQQWSPFCTIDSKTAQVACRNLGFTQTSSEYFVHII